MFIDDVLNKWEAQRWDTCFRLEGQEVRRKNLGRKEQSGLKGPGARREHQRAH